MALLGIDVGTSGTKSVLVGEDAKVIASAMAEHPMSVPKPGWAEQEPAHWWQSTCDSVAKVMEKADGIKVKAIGLSGQMHGLVALNANREVIRPAILWNDLRTNKQCDWIIEKAGGINGLLSLTRNNMLPGYTAGKIIWLRDNEPENYDKLELVLNPKDYIRYLMTGEEATDASDGSGTGLFDVQHRKWCEELIELLNLDVTIFPKTFESSEIVGKLKEDVAEKLGLIAGIPVVAGGGDAVVQSTGSGVLGPGVLQVIIGTAGNVACATDKPVANESGSLQVFCNNAPNLWHCMGCSVNAGGSLAWFRNMLANAKGREVSSLSYDELLSGVKDVAPGAGGLLFMPYLQGERCPHNDPNARGAFIGLNLHHGENEMVRAVLEGVVYSLAQIRELFKDVAGSIDHVVTSGGAAKSRLWQQIQADVFESEVITVSGAAEGGAYGAAMIAGVGIGTWNDLHDATSNIEKTSSVEPKKENFSVYRDMFGVYTELYGVLKPTFDRLAKN